VTEPDRAMRRGAFLGGVIVFGASIAVEATHWLLTKANTPDMAGNRNIAAAIEGLVGVALLAWGLFRLNREANLLRHITPSRSPDSSQ
jgi:hypothetical protein